MGFFDFVKKAGLKILGVTTKAEAQESGSNLEAMPRNNPELARALEEFVRGLGLAVTDLAVNVVDDLATVSGKVSSQAEKEKVVLAVGNVEGIARVEDRLEVEVPEPEAVFYTVQSGDTLSKIAKEHYGKASKYPVIFEANRPMLKDPDKIYPGQVLRIPAVES